MSSTLKDYKRRDVYRIPTEDILVGDNHSRPYGHSLDRVKVLAEDIKTNGQMQPGTLRRNAEGQLELVAGFGRFEAIEWINLHLSEGEEPVQFQALIRRCNDSEAYVHNVRENMMRTNISPMEEAITIAKLMEVHGKTQPEVATIFGRSQQLVSQRLELLSLGEDARKRLHEGDITIQQALKLAKVNEQKQAMALAKIDVSLMKGETATDKAKSTQVKNTVVAEVTGTQKAITLPSLKKEAEEFWGSPDINTGEKALVDAVLAMIEGEGLGALLDWYNETVVESAD